MKDIKFSIFGSCVSRDVFRELGIDHMVEHYSSRMSLHSWISRPLNNNLIPEIIKDKSEWKKRMIYNDMVKTGLNFNGVKFLIIDFVAEATFDILEIDGTYITDSIEFHEYNLHEHFVNPVIAFERGSIEEQEHWIKACNKFKEELKKYDTEIILHKALYAHEYHDGVSFVNYPSEYIKQRNVLLKFYIEKFSEIVQPKYSIDIPTELIKADINHKWGLAPFHYVRAYYLEFLSQLKREFNIIAEPNTLL